MQPDNEDDAWRSIVENFGERAELGPEETPEPPREQPPARDEEPWDEERYVPPPPPPIPHLAPDRYAAWAGVLGAPAVLVVALLVGIHIPVWLGYLLVASFVGGFIYLVIRMPREPRDPGDDGARL